MIIGIIGIGLAFVIVYVMIVALEALKPDDWE